MDSSQHKNLVIFASGAGSNARAIINYFRETNVQIALIITNKPTAGVLQIASEESIPVCIYHKEHNNWDQVIAKITEVKPSLIVLAGYLLKIPSNLINQYPRKIINIHPALLPAYGGKGMFGDNVHNAVIAAGEKQSGITIHIVDEHYDTGDTILQATCTAKGEDAGTLAQKIHKLEHYYFPRSIEFLLNNGC